MSEIESFDLDDLHSHYTEKALIEESVRGKTVRTGRYSLTFLKASGRIASEKTKCPGRRMVNFQVQLTNDAEDKKATMFVEVSPEERRVYGSGGDRLLVKPGDELYDKDLKLDTPSKLWGQIGSIMNPSGALSDREVIDAAIDFTCSAFVSEVFRDEDRGYHDYESDEERSALVEAGYTPNNYVRAFYASKN